MSRRYSVVCNDELAEQIDGIAREYELTEQEVLRQLIRRGLEVTKGNARPAD